MKVKVSDMNCNHCVAKISQAVLKAGVVAKVDLKDKSVEFTQDDKKVIVLDAIKNAGYHPEEV